MSLHDEVSNIVRSLSDEWEMEPAGADSDWFVWVKASDGRQLYFRADRRKKNAPRIEIRGLWPVSKSQGTITPSKYAEWERGTFEITVARGRRAATIAGEIERRLLPDYNRVYAICRERADNYDNHERDRILVAAQLRELVGDDRHHQEPTDVYGGSVSCREIRVNGPDSVRLVIDANLEQAIAVITALKALQA